MRGLSWFDYDILHESIRCVLHNLVSNNADEIKNRGEAGQKNYCSQNAIKTSLTHARVFLSCPRKEIESDVLAFCLLTKQKNPFAMKN